MNNAGAASIVSASGTTNITFTNNSRTASTTDFIQGGQNVVVTEQGIATAGTVNVGTGTTPTGTVSVTETVATTATGSDAINVKGGTIDTVTVNCRGTTSGVTGGTVAVTGGSATTSVTVSVNTAAASTGSASSASTGVPVTVAAAISAGPGLQAVAAATAAAPTVAKAAVVSVTDGAVQIADANYNTAATNTITSVTLANAGASSYINERPQDAVADRRHGHAGLDYKGSVNASNSALALSLNGVGTATANVTLNDVGNEYSTLKVTTATADSYLVFR